jgi:tetratricopeptide (TPR) repeat protein
MEMKSLQPVIPSASEESDSSLLAKADSSLALGMTGRDDFRGSPGTRNLLLRERTKKADLALLWRSFHRVLVLLIFVSALYGPKSATASSCVNQPAFQQLVLRGGDSRLAYAERKIAYERAAELCPSQVDTYHSLSVLLLQHRDFEEGLRWTRRGLRVAPDSPQLKTDEAVSLLSEGHPEESLVILNRLPTSAQGQFYLGMAYRALGDHKPAQQAFSRALSLGYQDPYVLYVLIEQDRALHDKKQGLSDFQTLQERFPNSPWLHMVLGDAYLSRYDDSNAKLEYQQVLELNPDLPIVHFQLGFSDFNLADYSHAAEEFRREIDLNPGFGQAFLYLGTTLRRLGKHKEALPLLKRAVELDPNSVLSYSALAAAEREANQIDAAMETLRAGKKQFPQDSSFPAQLAALLKQIGRPDKAKEEAELAESLSRKSNRPSHGLGGEPLATNDLSEENSALAAAVREDSESARPATNGAVDEAKTSENEPSAAGVGPSPKSPLDDLSLCLKRHNAACATATLAAINDPKLQQSADYIELKARTRALQREEEEALAASQSAIEANPTQPQYFITEGHIYRRFGDHLAAIECFLKAAKLEPQSPEPLYFIATSFFLLAERLNSAEYYNRAEQNLKAALDLSPNDDRAEFMLGAIEAMQSRFAEASTHLQQAIRMKPANPYYHLHYGILLKRLGHNTAAMNEMSIAEKLNASYALTHYELGTLYEKLGNYPQARKQLESAVDLNPQFSAAYYHLRGVYHHLGLPDQSQRAYDHFRLAQARGKEEAPDPAATAISAAEIENVQHQP